MSVRLGFEPPGPVAAAFMASDAPWRAIMGPVGSGKTSCSLLECVYRTHRQGPGHDGVRRGKYAIVRDTYRNLWRTTIASWNKWFPRELGEWQGGEGGPASHALRFQLARGRVLEFLVEFIALGEHAVEDVMKGWEGTGAFLNEADRLQADVLPYVYGRTGRYPAGTDGTCLWRGVWCDFNAPDVENWTYETFAEGKAEENAAFFVQPSGLSDRAENLANLPAGYYEEQARLSPKWYVRRMVQNQWGYPRDGVPVFGDEYDDDFHCGGLELRPDPGLGLKLGFDAGLKPAMIVLQRRPSGQWRVLDEVTGDGVGPRRFGEQCARLLADRYPDFEIEEAWGDPSAAYGADKAAGERDWLETVSHEIGAKIKPAPTNALIPRLEAVRDPLRRLIDGSEPGLRLSMRCRALRRGFNAAYRYMVRVGSNAGETTEQPDKNDASHPMDALQYALLGGGEQRAVAGRRRRRREAQERRRREQTRRHYDPMAV